VLGALEALDPGFELVTIYYGAGADVADAQALAVSVEEWRSGVDVEWLRAGSPYR